MQDGYARTRTEQYATIKYPPDVNSRIQQWQDESDDLVALSSLRDMTKYNNQP